jgi:2-keto-4-pentenoate hydratase
VSAALDPAAAARALVSARQAGRTLDVLLSSEAGLSLADAYRVQDQVTALRLAGGERRAGWKLGYTSAVMRAQMGIDAPNFGPLTDAMLLSSPAILPGGARQPRIEPEIGLRLGRRLAGPGYAL